MKKLILLVALFFAALQVIAQSIGGVQPDGSKLSNIITAAPFLLIAPQARSAAMGNAGVAVAADDNSSAINAAALAYLPTGSVGISISYSPWLKTIVPDMSLSYISGYFKPNERSTIAASLRYFSLGTVQFTDANFENMGSFNPNELAADISYARSFGPGFSLGGSFRFLYSGLFSAQLSSGGTAQSGKAMAVDVSGLYKTDVNLFGAPAIWSAGINLSNIGTKIRYSSGTPGYMLPANFKIGTAATLMADGGNIFVFALDLNKLMVPTQPIYGVNGEILKGKNPDRSVPAGVFGSFTDAPGGFTEEIKEVGVSAGAEYSYQQKFALRAGYNYQHPDKGGSRYFTMGAGFKYNVLSIDFAYLVASTQKSPLANTLRFSIMANLDKVKSVNRPLNN